MSSLLYQVFLSSSLLLLGLYHLVSSLRTFLKSPRDFSARPLHALPLSSATRLRHLPHYLLLAGLALALLHQIASAGEDDPLLKGHAPIHRLAGMQSAAVVFLFLLLSAALTLSETTAVFALLPSDLFFALFAAAFGLHAAGERFKADVQTSDLQAKCESIAAGISAACAALSLSLAVLPRLFVADVALAAAVCLQGLWALQTGLSLYVEAFIPEGCHRLLDVVAGVEGSTKCDLEESKLRAIAILDLAFVVHVIIVVITVFVVYFVVAKVVGVSRRFGSYEPLPNATAVAAADVNHVQLKTMTGTQA